MTHSECIIHGTHLFVQLIARQQAKVSCLIAPAYCPRVSSATRAFELTLATPPFVGLDLTLIATPLWALPQLVSPPVHTLDLGLPPAEVSPRSSSWPSTLTLTRIRIVIDPDSENPHPYRP